MEKLTEEQKKEILSTFWDNHMTEYIASRNDYYKTNDGLVIEIESQTNYRLRTNFGMTMKQMHQQ